MKWDDRTEWLWWKGAGRQSLGKSDVGRPVTLRDRKGTVRDVIPNAVLVEWDGPPPDGGVKERGKA